MFYEEQIESYGWQSTYGLSQHIVSFSHSSLQRYINFAELTKYGFWHTQMDLQASDVSGYVIGHVRWLLKQIFANMHIFPIPSVCLTSPILLMPEVVSSVALKVYIY